MSKIKLKWNSRPQDYYFLKKETNAIEAGNQIHRKARVNVHKQKMEG